MADATRSLMHDRDKAKTMKTLWLLGGLGLGAGLMYLVDSAQGEEPRDVVRRHLLDDTTRTLGRQAQAFLAKTPVPFRRQLKRQPGLGERLRTQAEQLGMTTGVVLLGCIGLGAGLVSLLEPQGGPQRRARLREKVRAYWHTAETSHTPEQELRRAWRFFQGHATQRVDAHTRKPAQAEAWYAEPADYDGIVLYSEPFISREEAATWAKAQDKK